MLWKRCSVFMCARVTVARAVGQQLVRVWSPFHGTHMATTVIHRSGRHIIDWVLCYSVCVFMVMCTSSQRRQGAVRCFRLLVLAVVTTDGCEGLFPMQLF